MERILKNKKGFTLVELLAVIVILALIMSIAIYSISGILQSSRENTFKETALNIINGVRMQITSANELKDGTYYFSNALLENDNELPFGGKVKYAITNGCPGNSTGVNGTKVDGKFVICRATSKAGDPTVVKGSNGAADTASASCTQSTPSFVNVTYSGGQYVYYICLTPAVRNSSSQRFISAKEADLMGNSETTVFNVTPES